MSRFRTIALLVLVVPAAAHAETTIRLPSCAEAQVMKNWYDFCQYIYGSPFACTPPDITQCWDFENGFAPWTQTGSAFANQPTYGDNVVASRVLATAPSPIHPGMSMLAELDDIGGDYWQTAYPIGHQGQAWLGTFENRPTPTSPWAATQGDAPTGTAFSPAFVVDRNYVSFLVGGGCDYQNTRVELQVYTPPSTRCYMLNNQIHCIQFAEHWDPAPGYLFAATVWGGCSETMQRRSFYTGPNSGLQGQTVRVAVIDNATSGPFGHINVDHVLHSNTLPADANPNVRSQPLWGIADTHAHFDAEHSMLAVSNMQFDGHLIHGSVGTDTNDHNLLMTQLPSCDSRGHGTNTTAIAILQKLETSSLGGSPGYPLGCFVPPVGGLPWTNECKYPPRSVPFNKPGAWDWSSATAYEHFGEGVVPKGSDLVGWPYWYTRTHQQMHLTWVKRAYAGGQRLMVAAAVNNELLGMAMRQSDGGDYLSDYGALRRFAINMKNLAAANSSWMEIAYTPADARRIIGQNKLAIVLATEVDDLGDHCAGDFTPQGNDDPMDHNMTTTTEGHDPWNQERDRIWAASCTTESQWRTRVDNLYNAGYRVVIPIHLADNDLGGTAIYSDLFNAFSRYMTGSFISAVQSADVTYLFAEKPNHPGEWDSKQAGWTRLGNLLALPSYGPAITDGGTVTYPYPADRATNMSAPGFVNVRSLTSNGLAVIAALEERGMVIDVAHLDQIGREQVLGLGNLKTFSPLNWNCDMSTAACQQSAYPVISSHAGLRELQPPRDTTGGGKDEAALRRDIIERIRDIGGTVAVGVSASDSLDVDDAALGTWTGINAKTVANTCAGSSRSFAQSYIYALRRMNGKGITLGTDFNGLEDRLNPRFGTQGCYARGNIPWSLHISWDGSTSLVSHTSQIPIRYRPGILGAVDGTAGLQREIQKTSTPGLRYRHYGSTPPSGAHFLGLKDPAGYVPFLLGAQFGKVTAGTLTTDSMQTLSGLPALKASQTGNRTFDLNYDGYAHYGMMPDVLQDARVVGMTNEQLSPLFQGAESFVQTWERGCRFSNPVKNGPGCAP